MSVPADLEKKFKAALNYAKNGPAMKLTNDQQLEMYALFKQATIGPVNTKQPGRLQLVERAKWDAWNKLGKLTKSEAMQKYIAQITKLAPNWERSPPPAKL